MIKKLIICLLMVSFSLTGCGDLIEIQERDFVLALGVSYQDGEYRITYSLPDLAEVTEQSKESDSNGLIRTYTGRSLPEIEQTYNYNSENRLDYRHLKAIILDQSICSDSFVMQKLLVDLNENYDVSNNVLVYYYDSAVEEVMGIDSGGSSIGERLKKLSKNNDKSEMEPARIGNLIASLADDRVLFIPGLKLQDESVALNGGILFSENHLVKQINQLDCVYYFISLGQGEESLIRLSAEHLIQIKDVKTKTRYLLTEEGPVIQLMISGTAKSLLQMLDQEACPEEKMNQQIREEIERLLVENMKAEQIDYLNLYEKSSFKNKEMWLLYAGRKREFIEALNVQVFVDIGYQ